MARTTLTVSYPNLNDLTVNGVTTNGFITQVNAALALLTNPNIRQWSVSAPFIQKRMNYNWLFFLEYDTGGASLATPFTLRVDGPKRLLSDLNTAVNTFLASATGFVSGGRLQRLDADTQMALETFTEWRLLNSTSGASANYNLL